MDINELAVRYLDLLKKCLTDAIYAERRGESLEKRRTGSDVPEFGDSMIGLARMDNLEFCLVDALEQGIPGDFVECGVWRGGACILARAIQRVLGADDRRVWVVDSFRGLPPPRPEKYPADARDKHYTHEHLRISREDVAANFERYGLLDDGVRFLEGWFHETLPTAPIERINVLRLDGDMYESTIESIEALYPKLSVGGYLIVDDFAMPPCLQAIADYRRKNGIADEIVRVDWTGIYWRRSESGPIADL